MDPNDEMTDYISRWKEVEAIQRQEMRSASMELRWKQLNAIFNMAHELGLRLKKSEEEDMSVILKWAKLKDFYARS